MAYSVWDAMNACSIKSYQWKEYFIEPDTNGNGVSAFYYGGDKLLEIAPGRYVTTDVQIHAFLDAGYPRVTFVRAWPIVGS